MKYLNDHFKLVEEKLGFPQEAVELFEKIALKIENSKSFSERFQKTLDKYLLPEAHDFGGMCDDMKKLAFCYRVKEYSLKIKSSGVHLCLFLVGSKSIYLCSKSSISSLLVQYLPLAVTSAYSALISSANLSRIAIRAS